MDLSEETINRIADRVIQRFEQRGLMAGSAAVIKQEQLKDKILRKKWITYKEIADSNIWDVKSKSGVERIVKEDVDKDCLDTSKQPFKIHRSEVERIAKNRGTL